MNGTTKNFNVIGTAEIQTGYLLNTKQQYTGKLGSAFRRSKTYWPTVRFIFIFRDADFQSTEIMGGAHSVLSLFQTTRVLLSVSIVDVTESVP
jgi:hypothetical protein